MATIFSRILRYGAKNFWRYGWASTATVAVMILALLVFMGLVLFRVVTAEAVTSIEEKIDISVYFKTTTPEDQVLAIKDAIEGLSEVKAVEYISRERALEVFKENHKDDPVLSQAINELTVNPLQASLNVKAFNPGQYAAIAAYFSNSPNLAQYIDSVSYYENQVVIDRLNTIIANVNRGGFALTLALALVAALVIFNTVWLAIYSNRDEIGIMRVVGASNLLVRGPYVVEGIIGGFIAAIVSLVLAAPIVYFISPYLQSFVPNLSTMRYFLTHLPLLLLYQLVFGIGLGAISSFIAVRRYLRN